TQAGPRGAGLRSRRARPTEARPQVQRRFARLAGGRLRRRRRGRPGRGRAPAVFGAEEDPRGPEESAGDARASAEGRGPKIPTPGEGTMPGARRAFWLLSALLLAPTPARAELHGGIEIGAKGVKATVIDARPGPDGLAVKVLLAGTHNSTLVAGIA